MYSRVLVTLENTAYDRAILDHVRRLAASCGASVVLIHVADGWAARSHQQLVLRESEEMQRDRAYLERTVAELVADGVNAEAVLASGDPAREIALAAEREGCDLIAMATHGHRFLGDLLFGSVSDGVRHRTAVPVLLVRGRRAADDQRRERGQEGSPADRRDAR